MVPLHAWAGGFYLAIWKYAGIILLAAPLFAASDFVEQRLVLEWRRWLTTHIMAGYFANRAFYNLHHQLGLLDNPDQVLLRALCLGPMRPLPGATSLSGSSCVHADGPAASLGHAASCVHAWTRLCGHKSSSAALKLLRAASFGWCAEDVRRCAGLRRCQRRPRDRPHQEVLHDGRLLRWLAGLPMRLMADTCKPSGLCMYFCPWPYSLVARDLC